MEVRVVGDDGADVEPGSAAVGEVWCRQVSHELTLTCGTACDVAAQSAFTEFVLEGTLIGAVLILRIGVKQPAFALKAAACRGPTVFGGYRGDVSATAAAFGPGGWFRTGDLACLGARGYLTIVDRRIDMVRP